MDIACVWIFVCMLCYKIFPVIAGFNTELVIFRVNRKHKDTRRCAMESLHHTFGRKDDLTGDCKKLTQAINQTQTVGAGHIEQVYIKKDFNTVMKAGYIEDPGVEITHIELQAPLITGSRIDFHCSRTPAKIYMFQLNSGLPEKGFKDEVRIEITVNEAEESGSTIIIKQSDSKHNTSQISFPFDWKNLCPSVECKISVHILDGKIEILANDQKMQGNIIEVPTTLIKKMKRVSVLMNIHGYAGLQRLNRFEFTKQGLLTLS